MKLKKLKYESCLLDYIISSCRKIILFLCSANVFINDFENNLNGVLIKFEVIIKEKAL